MEAAPERDLDIEDAPEQDDEVQVDFAQEALEELDRALSTVQINNSALPMPAKREELNNKQCPLSYKRNCQKEKLLIALAENFRRQFTHLYPDRKPLFLSPLNECGVEKFVSTTLRPTVLPYPDLFHWEGCTNFVSDFLSLEPLDPPTDPPRHLYSPTCVLQTQRGSCFDFSTLLCSLLLAAGYNAYCVSGYATKDVCFLNLCHQECPLLANREKGKMEEQAATALNYSVKPPRDLSSGFERRQEETRQKEVQAVRLKKQQEADRLQEELEKPPPDPLYGLRVHCWVLVKCGAREVPEDFFIEPLSGKTFPTTDENFLGIESAWNNHNHWVNMQDCRHGCTNMSFDLGDPIKWEYLLCGDTGQSLLLIPAMTKQQEFDEDEEDKEESKAFEMPPSWVSELHISQQDMEMRCPGGVKVLQYRKAKLEKFAPYLLKDGLLTRLTTCHDLDCTHVCIVKEWYQHRNDHLEERELRKDGNITLEHFRRGRSFALKSHRYVTLTPDSDREMEFYSQARADGLARRVEAGSEMTENFEDRPDFLFYRHTVFGKRNRILMPGENMEQRPRPLMKVVERFHRDTTKPASEDVEERVFLVSEERIQVTYHRDDDRIIPAWSIFTTPQDSGNKNTDTFAPDMASTFQVDPFQKPSKNLFLYETLMGLMNEQEKVAQRIKDSEKEVRAILELRQHEENTIELHISIYNTARNDKARKHREALERMAEEARLRREEKELDFLAPFLAQLGDPDQLTRQMALQLRSDCLADLKQRLIDKANRIQARFEKETQELQQKQQWYQKNQLTMNKEDEDQYLAFCSDAMFRIHIFKLRLSRHKDRAPQKYLALDEKLRRDPRLTPFL
ncbi:dynein regulatory complex subunit 7 [Clupea harengus]|uniref:Dynein regulatory complex subunit 7 n=1 Tax=Clupea harengus TaxID=7950 RepID=A0A6P8EW18_CLUHA|nr:dynein regulatory complex subunit 7 [Clupea harengus]